MSRKLIAERQGTYIKTGEDHHRVKKAGGYRQWVSQITTQLWTGHRINWTPSGDPLPPIIVRNNWAVECPYCRDAFLYEPGYDFFCRTCLMQGNGGQPRPVDMPANRVAIETTLEQRPDPHTRNYLIGETIDDLKRENAEHGIGLTVRAIKDGD